ncbi:unnamed protein product [[Actinomadura] parvosata subsp. kistnae]|uniref:Uncharacterized protein n=1 Tax=[Actinomadura] parvosata subsp. kistnae TaxID=1909395 RepID=A0A1V0ABL2_9ACTN|nr:hypothetical protein [Nonomuraea sp. ATCC 55076]AQZ67620.1 hypothetical protein BKM31_44680 [Nonomuraea sp. ATCC 55076]SPL94096.1 unnamed protein product [Actinomadura parvosata subsp. kistnae]
MTKPANIAMELGFFHGEADGECHRCRSMFEVNAYAAFHDGEWTCPDCADAISPGFGDIIRGLDRVYDGITCDLFTRRVLIEDLNTVTHALRRLAEVVDDIAAGRTKLHLDVQAVEGSFEENGQLIGVSIDRQIVTSKENTQ